MLGFFIQEPAFKSSYQALPADSCGMSRWVDASQIPFTNRFADKGQEHPEDYL